MSALGCHCLPERFSGVENDAILQFVASWRLGFRPLGIFVPCGTDFMAVEVPGVMQILGVQVGRLGGIVCLIFMLNCQKAAKLRWLNLGMQS